MDVEKSLDKITKKYEKETDSLNVGIEEESTAFTHYSKMMELQLQKEKEENNKLKFNEDYDISMQANEIKKAELELRKEELEESRLARVESARSAKKTRLISIFTSTFTIVGTLIGTIITVKSQDKKLKQQQMNLEKAIEYETNGVWTTQTTKSIASDATKM